MRIREIEDLRGIAIIGVISIHVSAYFALQNEFNALTIANIIWDAVSSFAVPLFIFISGLVLSIRYYGRFDKRRFYRRRIERIIPAYLLFSTIFIILTAYETGNQPSMISLAYNYLTAHGYFHLAYIALIMQLYILYPIILMAYDRFHKRMITFLILLLSVQIVYSIFCYYLEDNAESDVLISLAQRFFLLVIFYFVFGMYVGRNWDMMKRKIAGITPSGLLMIVLLCTIIVSYIWSYGISYYGSWGQTPAAYLSYAIPIRTVQYVVTFLLLIYLAMRFQSRILATMGKYSFGIYLIHPLFIYIFERMLEATDITYNMAIFYPMMFFGVLSSSFIAIFLLGKLPHSKLIGCGT